MSGNPMPFSRTEQFHHVISHPDTDIQQLSFSRSLIIGNGCFYHMTGTIHFVLVHILPPPIQPGQSIERIDISVKLLCRCNIIDPFVRFLFQLRVRIIDKTIRYSFKSFIHIRIIKENAGMLSLSFSRIHKVLHTSRLILDLVDTDRKSSRNMPVQTWRPKIILYPDMRKIHLVPNIPKRLNKQKVILYTFSWFHIFIYKYINYLDSIPVSD